MEPIARIEIFLANIAGESYALPVPQTRVELFLANIAGESYELPEPEARVELYLAKILGQNVTLPVPQSRIDRYLAAIAGEDVEPPEFWITRVEYWLAKWAEGSGGQIVTVTGVAPLLLERALAQSIHSLTQYGLCVQDGTPTPDAPVDIMTNNGAIKLRRPSGMPIAYQMVEWLKPTGAVLITDFKTKSTQEIETVFYREQRGSSYLYSSDTATSGTTNTTAYLTTAGGNWRWDGKVATINPTTGIKLTSIQNEDGVWLNGTRAGWYTDAGEFVSTSDLKLSSNENTTVRIYSMTIREGETVTLDLVPVQRVTDNAYGFYDKVSGNFYTNADATFEVGDQIPDPVEIYTDGEGEVLTVSGANLFDASSYTEINAYVNANTGVLTAGSPLSNTQYCAVIPCKPNAQYNITGRTASAWGAFPSDSIGTAATEFNKGGILTTGPNDRYLIGLVRANGDAIDYRNTLVVQEAQTVNDVPMLLSVGDYKDEVELVGGIKTGKVGVVVFDGTETNWRYTSGVFAFDNVVPAKVVVICTHFVNVDYSTSISNQPDLSVKGHSTNTTIYFKYNALTSLTDWTDWLAAQYAAGKPLIVVYPLATETTEQGAPHALHTSEGTVVVDVTANVSPVELEVEFTQASA